MTARNALSTEARDIIAEKLKAIAIELYDIELQKENHGLILRIYIDTRAGVDTDTCVAATRAIKDYIDTLDDLDYDYLEVSSPGIDRILKQESDFIKYRGSQVMVKTCRPVEGKKKFVGILAEVNSNILDLEMDGNLVHLNREMISVVRLHPDI
jgi:ribosome maturation factor RimP